MSRNIAQADKSTARNQTNRCQNCNSFISSRFARVFGNNNDQVSACLNCANLHVLRDGDAGVRER